MLKLSSVRRFSLTVLTMAFTVLFFGCDQQQRSTAPTEPVRVASGPGSSASPPGLDGVYYRVEKQIGGFAGAYLQDSETLILLNAGKANKRQLKRELQSQLPQGRLASITNYTEREVEYDWSQLVEWKRESRSLLYGPNVNSLDITEKENQLTISIPSSANKEDVVAALIDKDIPRDAFRVRVKAAATPLTTVRDSVRPIGGGLQIKLLGTNTKCTHGYNVKAKDAGYVGMLINSHCTLDYGGIEDTTVICQNDCSSSDKVVADEWWDETFSTADKDCPDGKTCRHSDAAFIRWHSTESAGSDWQKELVYKAAKENIDIVGEYTITGNYQVPLAGDSLTAVGRTTGRYDGVVPSDATCVDQDVDDSKLPSYHENKDRYLFCQDGFDVSSSELDSGDSGSPTFIVTDPTNNEIKTIGIVWGEGSDYGWLSSLSQIYHELPDTLQVTW